MKKFKIWISPENFPFRIFDVEPQQFFLRSYWYGERISSYKYKEENENHVKYLGEAYK